VDEIHDRAAVYETLSSRTHAARQWEWRLSNRSSEPAARSHVSAREHIHSPGKPAAGDAGH